MSHRTASLARHRRPSRPAAVAWLTLGLATFGCSRPAAPKDDPAADVPEVQVVHPERRNVSRQVGNPSFIESYERTSIFPKVTGYIKQWNVDIGDRVKKGQVMATLFVPELEEDLKTKQATVAYDRERVELAEQLVKVAEADVMTAEAALAEAKAQLEQYQAQVSRWETQFKRLTREQKEGVVDPQIVLETENQTKASRSARDAAQATIRKAEATLAGSKATLKKDVIDVGVARTRVAVAESDAKRLAAWNGYLTLAAPYDGVVVARNANTGDFVKPTEGDPTADPNAPYTSPGGRASPIYVVDRLDVVRVFVDVPERDANYVRVGDKATVLARAYSDDPIPGSVTRTAWALNVKSRTLRAEIDLPNPGGRLLPGMYAYGNVEVVRNGVWLLPKAALAYDGDRAFYWAYEGGKARRVEVQTGPADGGMVEVLKRRSLPTGAGEKGSWAGFDGSEQAILGDTSSLTDGDPVRIGQPSQDKSR